MKTKYVPRVNQIDALQLDKEIFKIVRTQFISKEVQTFLPDIISRCSPEIDLVVKSVLWHFGINNNYATFGQNLLSTCYDKNNCSKSKLASHYTLTVVFKYLKDVGLLRLTKYASISKLLTFADEILVYASVLVFFTFLKTGRKPSLTDFVLNMDHITMYGNKRRNIGYTYMTRELLWGGFMEFLAFTVSIINYHSLARKIKNPFSTKSSVKQFTKPAVLQMSTKCEYCHEKPILPHRLACEHVFCYYCLKGCTLADPNFNCCEVSGQMVAV